MLADRIKGQERHCTTVLLNNRLYIILKGKMINIIRQSLADG